MKVKLINKPISDEYGFNLLKSRGIEDVGKFLNPDITCLQTWRDLENIDKGVELIKNLNGSSYVGLIVDADVDGYTSAAIMYKYLRKIYPNINIKYYIHSGKGHGLEEHWRDIRDEDFDLLIIPDASSNDSLYIDKVGVPTLVIDHHILEDKEISPLMTLINNQESPRYKNKNLSGAGMVFQFCRALDEAFNVDWAFMLIDLAALGVCADMMSGLEIENQYLWHQGFGCLHNYFFLTLARKQAYSITGETSPSDYELIRALNPTSVAFYIVPLINAMVRMGSQAEKERMFEAFIDGHKMIPSGKRGAKGTMEEIAVESTRECTNARAHQNKFLDDITGVLEQKIFKHDLLENKILFIRLDEEDFPSELNGLVAMRLSQKYKHPTVVARLGEDGYIKGSIRGLSNCELTSFKNYLTSTGLCDYVQGHDNAAGISIPGANLSKLHERANKELAQFDFDADYFEVNFERQALAKDLPALIYDLNNYNFVWSQQNPQPLIYVKDLHFTQKDIQVLGRNKDTLKIEKNGVAYMKFFAKETIEELKKINGDIKIEVVGKPNTNEWMGTTTPQIFIEQIEIKEDRLLDF